MYRMPWLAVAVYVRAPAAEAPMQTDIAANSDSTLMYSHGASAPVLTSEDSPSTMCVCGEIGYAPITSGRQSATVSATAREPSICLSTCQLLDSREGRLRGGDVALPDRAVEALAERGRHGIQRDRPRDRGERGEHRRTRHRPPEMLAGDLARRQRDQMFVRHLDVGARAVEEDGAVLEAGEHAGDVQERGVLDHEHVRVHDRLARADGRVTDPAERHHRRAGALGPEARERLRVAAVEKRGDRQQLGGGDDALAAAAVEANLDHAAKPRASSGARHPRGARSRIRSSPHRRAEGGRWAPARADRDCGT